MLPSWLYTPVSSLYSISLRRLPTFRFQSNRSCPIKIGTCWSCEWIPYSSRRVGCLEAFHRAFHAERHDSPINRPIQSINGTRLKLRNARQPMNDANQKPPRRKFALLSRSHMGSELVWNRWEISA